VAWRRLGALLMGHWLLGFFGLDSASGTAYLAWSGIVGDAALLGAAFALWKRWTCHTWWCPRHGHYDFTDAATGLTFRLCRCCHPAHHGKRLTRNHIAGIHKRNQAARAAKRLAPRTPGGP
jgi:hypothetical protein